MYGGPKALNSLPHSTAGRAERRKHIRRTHNPRHRCQHGRQVHRRRDRHLNRLRHRRAQEAAKVRRRLHVDRPGDRHRNHLVHSTAQDVHRLTRRPEGDRCTVHLNPPHRDQPLPPPPAAPAPALPPVIVPARAGGRTRPVIATPGAVTGGSVTVTRPVARGKVLVVVVAHIVSMPSPHLQSMRGLDQLT